MKGWFLANLFIIGVVLLAAGCMFAMGWIYHRLDENGFNAWIGMTCAVLATVGTFYAARALWGLVNRWVNGGNPTRR